MRALRPAELLLQSLGITDPCQIDVEAIAYDQGATVKYRRLDGCEARIVGTDDRAVISVDDSAIPVRRRFSTAHELGHWYHHRGRSFICRPEDIGDYRRGALDPERVADGYAADLLLPNYLFEPRASALKAATFEGVDALRNDFQTSITATAIRLVEHGPEPAMLVCHGKGGRRWFNRPRQVPERWFPRQELDADSYAMDVLFGDTKRSRRRLMPAEAWFDHYTAGRYQVYEQSQKATDGEILTLLTFKDGDMLDD